MKKIISGILLLLVFLNPAHAKWAAPSDAFNKVTSNIEINVNSDGTFEQIEESTTEILNEISRSTASHKSLYYTDDNEEIEILEAKTIYKGKEYPVDKSLIEDKSLASSHLGFDQKRQILLAFPRVEVGSVLYLKYKLIQKVPNLENFFSDIFYFGRGDLNEKAHIKINSKLPLHILVNDPKKLLKVNESADKSDGTYAYALTIDLLKPNYESAINEPDNSIVDEKHYTWVLVSSMDNWQEFAVKQSDVYDKVLAQKLPKEFEEILEKAKEKTSDIDKINIVTSMLNERVRYLGDWRSVAGRYQPRDLETVEKAQLGDCKDFATITAAILKRLGFKAQVVLVERGMMYKRSAQMLPGFNVFDHAMTKVTSKDGKVYWVDPTNFASMAGGIFPDIADRMVLVLDAKQPVYEKIPAVDFNRAKSTVTGELEILKNGSVIESGHIKFENEVALNLIGVHLKVSDEIIKNYIFSVLAGKNLEDKNKRSLELPRLDSRIVEDVSFSYSFEKENDVVKTNIGPAIKLNYDVFDKIYDMSQDYVSDVFVESFPTVYDRQTVIKNVGAKNIETLNKEMDSPWLYIKRNCYFNKNNNLQIDIKLVFYKNVITSEDLKNPEFIKLKSWLEDNFKNVVIVFEPKEEKKGFDFGRMIHKIKKFLRL